MPTQPSHNTHSTARICAIAAAILASAVAVEAQAEQQIVTIRLTPDPLIEAHIRKIQGPERTVRVSIDKPRDSQSKSQKVSVRGPIGDSHIARLVKSVVAGTDGYWTKDSSWGFTIVGDEAYAIISVSHYCGLLCGGGASYTYAFKDGAWNFEYTSNQWVS